MTYNPELAAGLVYVDMRLAGLVKRYHTWPKLHEQTVAEHTWQVLRIYTNIFGPPDTATFLYIMFHDAGELVTGDVPYSVKADNEALAAEMAEIDETACQSMAVHWGLDFPTEPSLYQASRVKLAELIEMAEEGMHELEIGNQFGWLVTMRTLDKAYAFLGEMTLDEQVTIRAYVSTRLALLRERSVIPLRHPSMILTLQRWELPK